MLGCLAGIIADGVVSMGFELPPPPPGPAAAPAAVGDGPPVGFDFAVEMRETRLEVDRLLGQGMVAKAEAGVRIW